MEDRREKTSAGFSAGAVVAGIGLRAGQRDDLRHASLIERLRCRRGLGGVRGVLTVPLAFCRWRCLVAAAPPLPGSEAARELAAVRKLAGGAPAHAQLQDLA